MSHLQRVLFLCAIVDYHGHLVITTCTLCSGGREAFNHGGSLPLVLHAPVGIVP